SAWRVAIPEAAQLMETSFLNAPLAWWRQMLEEDGALAGLARGLAFALFAGVLSWAAGVWMRHRYGRVDGIDQPSYGRRLLAGMVEGGARSIGPIIFVLLAAALAFDKSTVQDPLETVVEGAVRALVLFFLGYALIKAGVTTRYKDWHLLDFEPEAAHRLRLRLKAVLIVFLSFDALRTTTSWAAPSSELGSIGVFLFTMVMTPLLISLMGSRIWGPMSANVEVDGEVVSTAYPRVRTLLAMALATLPVAAMVGYPGLAAYIVGAAVMSGLLLAGLVLLRSAGRESLAAFLDPKVPLGNTVRTVLALGRDASRRLQFALYLVFDLVLLLLALRWLLEIWGLGAEDSGLSLTGWLRGVQIGSYTFSLVDVGTGLFLFGFIIFVTRMIQRGLERHILPNLTNDKGVQDALRTGVGYIGMIVALLASVSVLGLDLTNLALIAGALSVGLGFGLQNVVNNFVSGLILLAERPIKPGDWVVVGGYEGKVKKVNVRSTEMETFQRASVIIPNADLIATPVMNWTHKNVMGRVEVLVGVAYGTDPRQVERILLECAQRHSNVMKYPEPSVLFTDFADSSLNFELRAYLSDVEKRVQTGSDLRFAIHDAFAAQAIEIPFPQRVVHLAPTPAAQAKDTDPS
ncbi:MAG: mechanosensitive ion channel family protein, partial [Alphaproteobacteria bacterium]|nr:mechanosensitive ion channel family protein [Alphaproteobacteria bacterium]